MAHAHDTAHEGGHEAEGNYGHVSVRTYWMVFGGLMILMVATVAAYYLEKTVLHLPEIVAVGVAMAIAIAKTSLIIIFFMHVKVSSRLTQVFAASSFVWLLIMFVITMGDYFAKGWPPDSGPLSGEQPSSYVVPAAPYDGWRATF